MRRWTSRQMVGKAAMHRTMRISGHRPAWATRAGSARRRAPRRPLLVFFDLRRVDSKEIHGRRYLGSLRGRMTHVAVACANSTPSPSLMDPSAAPMFVDM